MKGCESCAYSEVEQLQLHLILVSIEHRLMADDIEERGA